MERAWVQKQAEALQSTDYFPRNDGGAHLKLLVDVLMHASSEPVVTMVIHNWLLKNKERPTAADLYALVNDHNAAIDPALAQTYDLYAETCPDCSGSKTRTIYLQVLREPARRPKYRRLSGWEQYEQLTQQGIETATAGEPCACEEKVAIGAKR